MSALEIFDNVWYTKFSPIATICAANVILPNFKITWKCVLFEFVMFLGFMSVFWGLYDRELAEGIIGLAGLGSIIQGFTKHLTVMFNRHELHQIIKQIRHIHLVNNDDLSSVNHKIMLDFGLKIAILVNLFLILCFVTISLFATSPIPIYIFTGDVSPIFPLYIPFLDENTVKGYCGLSFMHIIWLAQTGFGLAVADMSTAAIILYILPMVGLFRKRFEELSKILTLRKVAQDSELVYQCLRNLVKMHQDMCLYLTSISDIYFCLFFTEVVGDALSILLIIYILTTNPWFPLYLYFVFIVFKLLAYCLLGMIVETAMEDVLSSIQTSSWHLLPLKLQRCIVLMLCRAQNPIILRSGTLPLNLDTFVGVMKNVYSFAMILGEAID